MTLRNQLFRAIFFVFLVVFGGLLYLSLQSTKNYLQQQLASHAQDAASSLAYPLADSLAKKDKTLAEVQVLALYDRGYYQRILVLSADGKSVVDKQSPAAIENVPLWFTRYFPLDTQPGEAFISSGWRQFGKVIVVSQPTIAYEHLWNSVKNMSYWMFAMLLLALGLTLLLLHYLLKPLLQIENAALSICEKRFVQITTLPGTRELKRVVLAMNNMSRRAQENLDAEINRAESFRRQAYVDSVTGLDNRLSFDLRLGHLLEESGKFQLATLMILELDGLKELNNRAGYLQGDRLLTDVAHNVIQVLGTRAVISSRTGGTSFAFLCLDLSHQATTDLTKELQQRINEAIARCNEQEHIAFSLGCAVFSPADSRVKLLSRADMAVEKARQASRNGVAIIQEDEADSNSTGSLGWRKLIQNALTEQRWALLIQPVVVLRDRSIEHHEVMSCLIDNQGNAIAAAQFLPMALRHNLMVEVDQALITLIIDYLGSATHRLNRIAVNVTAHSITSAHFSNWLAGKLKEMGSAAERLSFEVSEFGCTRNLEATRQFATMLRQAGAKFGIDHFGLEPDSLKALRYLPPDYIKLDGNLVREANHLSSSRDHLKSIVQLASSLEIPVIAQCVETEAMVALLLEDNIQSGQGYYFGAPERL